MVGCSQNRYDMLRLIDNWATLHMELLVQELLAQVPSSKDQTVVARHLLW